MNRPLLGALVGVVLLSSSCGVPVDRVPPSAPAAAERTPESSAVTPPPAQPSPLRTPTATPSPSQSPKPPPSLIGDNLNAWAFAPLDAPERLVVEGSVPSQRAWSTSKLLVVAAFLDEACDGDPRNASAAQQREMSRSLSESDMTSVVALANAIPSGKQAGMTKVLRSIGDDETTVPSRLEGTMTWRVERQVEFLVALHEGRVVSPESSQYILDHMQPITSQSWGLGAAGSSAYKGGWLRANTETRQMGIVDGYAVALITSGVGPAEVQSDGDSAHVDQMNKLATQLRARLSHEAAASEVHAA
ncbi:hypothetical protein [Granulicoccus sp. GXG6511]|uniref:hypothetical protein n=1 Tax=Granulicoccus sp. GXG6511 TaxID=3381351 RepID=UPI003D7D2C5D